ncbi:MAG: aldehyde dehydrogenase family protein, partial [Gammaproteobacteria bacterium]|nr:aldehyde dehydrogenase family protein [Gammaproteobacteria bacterium]
MHAPKFETAKPPNRNRQTAKSPNRKIAKPFKQNMTSHYINGAWQISAGAPFTSVNPVTQATIWQGNAADGATVNAAVSAARAAFLSWSSTA